MTKRTVSLLVFILLLSTVFSWCFAQQGEVRQEVVAGLGRDPGVMYGYGAHPPLTRVFETLVFRDFNLQLQPGLALSWEVSADELAWTLHLRPGVNFHDGIPFNAEAVKHNLERLAKRWPGRLGPIKSIEVVDEYTVRISHSEPYAPFIYTLAWPGAAMISPRAVDEEGKVIAPIGTGPFKRVEWVSGEKMVLVRNEDYWGGRPKLERVTLKYIPDPATRVMALEAGEIDMIIDTGGILPEHVPTLMMHPRVEVLTVPGAVPHYMSLNTKKGPLADVRVRQAVVYALDPESIIKYALEGYGKVMSSITPHSEVNWLHPERLFQFNKPDRARELLRESGWEDSDGNGVLERNGEELSVTFLLASALVGRWPYMTIAEIVQDQLRAVGINVEIEVVETGLWRKTLKKGEVDISMRPWAGIAPQTRLYDWLNSKGSQNLAMGIFFSNPFIDELTEQALRTTDQVKAQQLLWKVQEIAAQEVPLIPFYDEVLINAVRDNIKGYRPHPLFIVNWEDIYVAE